MAEVTDTMKPISFRRGTRQILRLVLPHVVDLISCLEQLKQLFLRLPQLPDEDELRRQLDEATAAMNLALEQFIRTPSAETEANLRSAMDHYEELINLAFGFNIQLDAAPSLEFAAKSLDNYRQGGETAAQLFASVYEAYPDLFAALGLGEFNSYAFFQAVMGNINIVQTYNPPFDAVTWKCVESEPDPTDPTNPDKNRCVAWQVARGYTSGHTIYDILSYSYSPPPGIFERVPGGTYSGQRTEPMTADNFAHELMHSFLSASGFGDWTASDIMSFAPPQNGVTIRLSDEPVEIAADYLLNLGLGNFSIGSQGEQLRNATLNALLYNYPIPPGTVAEALGTEFVPSSGTSNQIIVVNTNAIIRSSPNGAIAYTTLPINTAVDLLGRTAEKIDGQYWVYVHAQYQSRSIYGWIRADLINVNDTRLSDLLPGFLGVYNG